MIVNKLEEMFDIYDEHMNWIGVAPRREVHAKGLWHQTFQCWIVSNEDPEPVLLLQLRHPDKDLFPNLLDISCAGHLGAGETIQDGVRELEEELGLHVKFEELAACGIFAEVDFISEELIDREFCHVFFYRCDLPLSSYVMQPEEVSGLFAVSLKEFESLIRKKVDHVGAKGLKRHQDGRIEETSQFISHADLVPHPEHYYDILFRKLSEEGLL